MKLSRAFTERARLTKAYEALIGNINQTDFNIEVKDVAFKGEEISQFTYVKKAPKYNLDEQLKELTELGNALALFNAAIDEANAKSEARFILSQLTNLRRQQVVIGRLVSYQDNFVQSNEDFDSRKYDEKGNQGVYITKYYIPASAQDFTARYKDNEKTIHELEDKLSEVNATTEVDVPQYVLDVLAGL